MSWPIGRARSDVRYATSPEGEVSADGVPVTDREGWLEVRLPDEATQRGLPVTLSVRVRVGGPGRAASHIYVEDVRAGDRAYGSLHHFAEAGGLNWIAHLIEAVRAELRRRTAEALFAAAESATPTAQPRRPA